MSGPPRAPLSPLGWGCYCDGLLPGARFYGVVSPKTASSFRTSHRLNIHSSFHLHTSHCFNIVLYCVLFLCCGHAAQLLRHSLQRTVYGWSSFHPKLSSLCHLQQKLESIFQPLACQIEYRPASMN